MPAGELLHEQERGAHVLVQERVHVLRGQLAEPAEPAARVVDDEDVDVAERVRRGCEHGLRRSWIREVRLESSRHAQTELPVVRAPRLGLVVRRPALHEDRRAEVEQAPRDRVSDARAPADPGDERAPLGEWKWIERRNHCLGP